MDNLPMINGLTVAITLSGLKLTMANSDEDEDPSMVNSDEDERIESCKTCQELSRPKNIKN